MVDRPVVQSCEELTPDFVSAILRRNNLLLTGSVRSVECSGDLANKGHVANVARAALTYSADARGALPARIFLKMSRADIHPELAGAGLREVAFYGANSASDDLPIPAVYAAEADADGRTHIVMEDLSETHFQRPLPLPPSAAHCEEIARGLARLHARWWNSPRLSTDLGPRLSREGAEATRKRLHASFPYFVDYLGDALLPEQRACYEKVLASDFLKRLAERLIAQQDVSVVHGDMHTGNVMLPRTEDKSIVFIDWHRWAVDLGTFDLAFMIALHWGRERRAALERRMLHAYHDTLMQHGVKNYTWQQCWDDYRTEVIVTMLIPIGQFRRGSPAGVVWFGLQDSCAAARDLDSLELL